MEFTDYLWTKLIVLAILAFFANFFYRLFTGRSLEEDLRGKAAAEREDHSEDGSAR
jgi:hypothetical protein